eukprot:TRINITY_DN46878_c0_g1_i1.p1 TRINITY_DN46878_c0_g1~~TRINITY_DN46878_c0_g1_i1.p1  ORF type:complete len:333 (+),score=53.79 TRINITY_DN46878_c0_g1_i1:379-1377(+)
MTDLQHCLDDVRPGVSLAEAAALLDGVRFRHPRLPDTNTVFLAALVLREGNASVAACVTWAQKEAPADVRAAVPVESLAAIRMFTGDMMCYVLRSLFTDRESHTPNDTTRWRAIFPFARLLIGGLRALPVRYRVNGKTVYRAEMGVHPTLPLANTRYAADEGPCVHFWSAASCTLDPNQLLGFLGPNETCARTLWAIEGASGYDLQPLSLYRREKEVVVEPGTAIIVTRVERHEAQTPVPGHIAGPGLVVVHGTYAPTQTISLLSAAGEALSGMTDEEELAALRARAEAAERERDALRAETAALRVRAEAAERERRLLQWRGRGTRRRMAGR